MITHSKAVIVFNWLCKLFHNRRLCFSMNEAPSKQRTNVFLDSSSFPPNRFRPSEINVVWSKDNRRCNHRPTYALDCASVHIRSSSCKRTLSSATTKACPLGSWVNFPSRRPSYECDSDISDSEDEDSPFVSENVRESRWSPNPCFHSKSLARKPRRPLQKSVSLDLAATLPTRKHSAGNLTSLTR
jgi:hypothetical protein